MNLVLFDSTEIDRPLASTDPRAVHIRTVLRREPGDLIDCGLIDGPRGKARLQQIDATALHLEFTWERTLPPLLPEISLLVGLPRPQTVRKILFEATTLGCAHIHFFGTEKGERSYAQSSLWTSGEVRRHLIAGAEQAFCTRLPVVTLCADLRAALTTAGDTATRIGLDNYEAADAFGSTSLHGTPAALAIGPERGWSTLEREQLRSAGYALQHLGTRVLRCETACLAALAIVRSRFGYD